MDGSTPQHYQISDFLKWNDDKELILNPSFQRGRVWSQAAKSYLIDSILRGYPIPKLLIRTKVDRTTRRTIRDVVDGQQRLSTIIDFGNDHLILGSKAGEFSGKRYSDLDPDLQDAFLAYKLTCEQLINASDEDVLEVFARINAYAVALNEAERRNAQFTLEFASYVKQIAHATRPQLRGVLSEREVVRMADQTLIAEIVGFFQTGVVDGAEKDITKIYQRNDGTVLKDVPPAEDVVDLIREAADLLHPLDGEAIQKRAHFVILAAALMYMHGRLPEGKLNFSELSGDRTLADPATITANLEVLNAALTDAEEAARLGLVDLREARSTTQRMNSRRIRFRYFVAALAGELDNEL